MSAGRSAAEPAEAADDPVLPVDPCSYEDADPWDPGPAYGLSYGVVFSQLPPRLVSQDASHEFRLPFRGDEIGEHGQRVRVLAERALRGRVAQQLALRIP